jgi:transitional endoplasmic reticulum ATPase
LRPGRFDRILEIPKPDGEGRRQILRIHMKKKPLDKSVDQERLVELTDGMTGADIVVMVNAAAMSAIKERVSSGKENDKSKLKITMKHFEDAIEKMKVQRKSAGRLHALT